VSATGAGRRTGAGAEPLTWRRLAGRTSAAALGAAVLAAAAETVATVVVGRVAAGPTAPLVALLAALLVGAALLDTAGRAALAGAAGRAEGRLRTDLLAAALHQPLAVLEEQAVGELIDRVDDDTRQLGTVVRRTGWELGRAGVRSVLAWVVAGLTWWPAWIAFPLAGVLVVALVRPLTAELGRRKLAEEQAWSEHAAQLEEAVAGRDDVRSSLGQAHVVRAYAQRGRDVVRRVSATRDLSTRAALRTGLVLHALLATVAVGGVALVTAGELGVAELVTLWLLVTAFAGQLGQVSNRLPEVQAALGALTRVRALLDAPQEPAGGAAVPAPPLGVEFRDLTTGYPGGFSLRSVSFAVPAGTTCALVGRTGAGKSTLAKLLSRAIEPPPGTVLVGGSDVTALDVDALRRAVGVVTQRTEILAASLEENIALFGDAGPDAVRRAVGALGLAGWVASLPDGLATRLGTGGRALSAGEEQLVAFARLLVRDVAVVVLDEATARMDPQTERLVTRAAERLLAGRTGIVVAHRLSTVERCDAVAVLDAGRVVQHGPRAELAAAPGAFRDLLTAAGEAGPSAAATELAGRGERRDPRPAPAAGPVRLARTVARAAFTLPRWGLFGGAAFALASLAGTYGATTGWFWGRVVGGLGTGGPPAADLAGLVLCLLVAPLLIAVAFRTYPLWWVSLTLRMRLAVLRGQTMQHRLPRTPPGEVVARALDSDRLVIYVDRWVDLGNGVAVVLVTALAARSAAAGLVIGGVLGLSALVSAAGAPVVGRAGRAAADARAAFGAALASALEGARTVKLAAATGAVRAHLRAVDARRVALTVAEQRVLALLDGVPGVLVQLAVALTWALHLAGTWDLAVALLVTTAVSGAGYLASVWGAVITEAPVARRWLEAMTDLAGGADLLAVPPGVDVVAGTGPAPVEPDRVPLRRLVLRDVAAVHDDGTVGVSGVDLDVEAGSLVLLTGRVGAGKSSLLAALAGLVDHDGSLRWNDREIDDPELFLRPGQVAYVGQVPRVLSGSFTDNIALGHARELPGAVADARLETDVAAAGGLATLVGHRGVRLSGGQVQRVALARALAADAELLVADDVSSALDARTELELWDALRRRGTTVVGSSSKRAALARADVVVVLEDGRVAAVGPWRRLAGEWGHLAG
jgi:ABC-type multidrug transport system fused ATPase/permease subunit